MRRSPILIAALILAMAVVPAATTHVAAATPHAEPKVAIIVGPSGPATDRYRAQARDAERAARQYTSRVVSVIAPNATWPAVRRAVSGASIVVYMGHGNGWPSRYRDHLFRPTQNGFGLNPVAGGADSVHQYFGEDSVAAVKLAGNAVVVLSHLCYASGNTEPGLPEGTLDEARQRVDNYAAGFVAAGAGAVIADGYLNPAWYVRKLLGGGGTVESIWKQAPSSNGGPILGFASQRSPGFALRMDPDRPSSGFYRSLVVRGQLAANEISASGSDVLVDPPLPSPASLARTGVTFGSPTVALKPDGSTARLSIPFTVARGGHRPDGVQLGVRWEPLGPATVPHPPAGPTTGGGDGAANQTGSGGGVEIEATSIDGNALTADVRLPNPGSYRVVVTLHEPDGVAYDAQTQQMLAPLDVTVPAAATAPTSQASGPRDLDRTSNPSSRPVITASPR